MKLRSKLDPNDSVSHAGLGVALAALGDPNVSMELDWLGAKVKTCGGRCPDADYMTALFDQVKRTVAGAPPQPVL